MPSGGPTTTSPPRWSATAGEPSTALAGPAEIPAEASWLAKPPGEPLEELLAPVAETTPVWRRQMVLGPAPEICIGSGGLPRRRVS